MPLLNDADSIRLGAQTIDRLYLGDTQVWPAPGPVIAGRVPADIRGLFRWWRADDIAGVQDDQVVGWADRVAGTVIAPGGTALNRPLLNLTGTKPPSAYTTATTGVSLRANLTLPNDAFSVAVVWRRLGSATSRAPLSMHNAASGTAARRFTFNYGTNTEGFIVYRDAGTTSVSDTAPQLDINALHVSTGIAVPSEGQVELFINGASDGPEPAPTPGAPQSGAHTFSLFQGNQASGNSLAGHIYEVCIWDHSLTAGERALWHSYVQDRYGVAVADYTPDPVPPTVARVGHGVVGTSLVG